MFELSGKPKEMANKAYNENYANFWIAHNDLLAFLKAWERQNKWCTSFEEGLSPYGFIRGTKRKIVSVVE